MLCVIQEWNIIILNPSHKWSSHITLELETNVGKLTPFPLAVGVLRKSPLPGEELLLDGDLATVAPGSKVRVQWLIVSFFLFLSPAVKVHAITANIYEMILFPLCWYCSNIEVWTMKLDRIVSQLDFITGTCIMARHSCRSLHDESSHD